MPSLAISLEPMSKMGCESIEIQIEAITSEERQAARGQVPSERVDEQVCHVLCTGTQLKHGKNLGAGIDGQPEPQHLRMASEPSAQFVQLQVREVKMAEGALVQGLCVLSSSGKPGGDGGLSIAEDPFGSRKIQPFGQRREHHCDLVGGGFQTVQGSVAPGSERGMAGLTAERLDLLSTTVLAIADQSVDLSIGDAEVGALLIGTGVALTIHPLGRSPPAFDLAPGAHRSRR
jgi:hypothetical protein